LESERVRKVRALRCLPGAWDRMVRAAAGQRLTISEFFERWALSLPSRD